MNPTMAVTLEPFKAAGGRKKTQKQAERVRPAEPSKDKTETPTTKSVHAHQTEGNLNSPQNSLSQEGAPAVPAKTAAPTSKGLKPLQRGGVKRRRVETDSEEEAEHTPSRLTRFKVPKKPEDFDNAYQLVRALEKERNVRLSIRISRDEGMIIAPKDKATMNFLQEIKVLKDGRKVCISPLTSQEKKSKMVLLGFPLGFDVEVITSLPQVVEASRMTKGKSPTRQVLVILKGAPITTLDLGNWGSYKLRTYVPEPLRCFTCQKFGHHQANCKAKAKCGVCSEAHETEVCIKAHKDGQKDTTAKCPNCAKKHHAWSLACSVRKQAVIKKQELAKKRPDFVPAPPGTYVWGQNKKQNKKEKTPRPPKRKESPPQRKLDTSNREEFPELASGKTTKKNQREKGSKSTAMVPPVDDNLFFDEKDMTLLLSAVVSAVATALGRTSEEAEKAVQVAMTAMTQTVAALKGRKLEASKPITSSAPLPKSSDDRLASKETSHKTPASLSGQAETVQQAESVQPKSRPPTQGDTSNLGPTPPGKALTGVSDLEEVVQSSINEDLYLSDATSTGASEAEASDTE